MNRWKSPLYALLAAACAAFAGVPASATSYVMVADEALVDEAPVAAVGRIAGVDRSAGDRPVTEYVFEVERALKGEVPGGTARVRVPGGVAPSGLALRVHGAPSFRPGERALLFLEPDGDGGFRIVHFLLGAFREVQAGGRRLAVRKLSDASEVRVSPSGGLIAAPGAESQGPRDFDAFATWVADRARGTRSAVDYLVSEPEELRSAPDAFTLFEDPTDELNLRWFAFDTGGNVSWKAHAAGQNGISGGGFSEFQAALKTWNDETGTPVDYRYTGTTNATQGLVEPDNINAILFNDPAGQVPAFSCTSGGVLAIGGPWYEGAVRPFGAGQYHRIVQADIVINDGLQCFFSQSQNASRAAQELFAHELGHTLGLGHSCGDTRSPSCGGNTDLDDALMRAFIHDDKRGGRLAQDDIDGLRALYSQNVAPATPTGLDADALSTTEIRLTWQDKATNETGYRVEMKTFGGDFVDVGGVGAGATVADVAGLDPATGYAFRVRATSDGPSSAYSNEASASTRAEPGPCVQDADTLCLNGGRFRVEVRWEIPDGTTGVGSAAPAGVDDSGLFWFFQSTNLEMLVKVLDGCGNNHHYWVFFAATTNVEFVVTVTDTQTGEVKTWFNPQGKSADAVTDIDALHGCP